MNKIPELWQVTYSAQEFFMNPVRDHWITIEERFYTVAFSREEALKNLSRAIKQCYAQDGKPGIHRKDQKHEARVIPLESLIPGLVKRQRGSQPIFLPVTFRLASDKKKFKLQIVLTGA